MTDQDPDGFHIKGLLINVLHYFWPSLVKLNLFIYALATPIVKVSKNKDIRMFYNISDYDNWKEENNTKGWHIKYYKGLGTSNSKEAKEYAQIKKEAVEKAKGEGEIYREFKKKFILEITQKQLAKKGQQNQK